MEELRAKDLAMIEPPGSMSKVVEFTERLSFGQDALFSGTELPTPPITREAFGAQTFAQQILERPYSMFPGANGESLDTLMARHTLRNRDIQDFSKWLRRWDDKRNSLTTFESPEQFFLKRASHDDIEKVAANRDVQRAAIDLHRKQVRMETLEDLEVERRVVRVRKKKIELVEEEAPATSRVRRRRHPRPAEPEEPDYGAYWREQPSAKAGLVLGGGRVASAAAAAPVDPGMMLSGLNRGLVTSNLSMGSMTTGLIKGQTDATHAYQAQEAAASAVQTSPVAAYMPPQPGQLYFQAPAHYPPPEVIIHQVPGGRPIEIRTDWPGAPRQGVLPGKPDDYVLVPRQAADAKGIDRGRVFRTDDNVRRGDAHLPGFAGFGSESFANALAMRALAGSAALFPTALLAAGGSGMPGGSVERRNILSAGVVAGAQTAGFGSAARGIAEPRLRTDIPVNPLMGQLTLVSPPMQVASERAERSGSVVAFDVKQVGKSVGTLDAAGLAMLQQNLPPGAQAIYPALPPGSLGPQAVNVKLAPSLLNQILTQGYGPGAGAMASSFAAGAGSITDGAPMQASIIPSQKRPIDAASGILPDHGDGTGALKHAGAGEASRGGAFDFLGMPVRLAPSLSGNADLKQATEARKVLPPGAAAVVRPNEFGAMRTKLFPGMQTLHAEPDKRAWQHAAPSFGLRDAEPHTVLAPDARLRPPHESAPLPQMEAGGQTATSRALHAATIVAPAASAAIGAIPGGGIVHRAAQATGGLFGGLSTPSMHLGTGIRHGLGGYSGGMGGSIGGSPFGPFGGSFGGRSHSFGSHTPSLSGGSRFSIPSAAASASMGSQRVASRFTPLQASVGGAHPSASHMTPGTAHSPQSKPERAGRGSALGSLGAAMAAPGAGRQTRPTVAGPSAHSPITPFATSSYSTPTMAAPAIATTASGRVGPLSAEGLSLPGRSLSGATSSSTSSSLLRRPPAMPIAASVPAGSTSRTATTIQRSRGGAVQASGSEHGAEPEHDSSTASAQDPGSSAHEVNLLANEVWSLLKRKLRFEAERLGRNY